MYTAMLARAIPPQLAAALITELCGLEADLDIYGVAAAQYIPINSGGRQGGTETTWCWNLGLEFLLGDLVDEWNALSVGFSCGGDSLVNHAIWADNIYLFGSSAAELMTMFTQLTDILYDQHLRWKIEELTYITGVNGKGWGDLEVMAGTGSFTIQEVEAMKVLGVMVDRRGSSETSIDYSLSRAEGAYGSISKLLKDKRVPCSERLRAWCRGPVGAALYAAGGFALSRTNIHKIRRWECNHVRSFLNMRQLSLDEGRMEYNRRTNKIIHGMFVKHGLYPVYIRALKGVFNWARAWWIFKHDEGQRPLYDIMNHRPAATWEDTRTEQAQWDYQNRTGWRHQFSGRRLQWEDQLNAGIPQWRSILQNGPQEWRKHCPEFLRTICGHFKLNVTGLKDIDKGGAVTNAGRKRMARSKRKKERWW